MTNEQILKKAIEKAIDNGFSFDRGEVNYLIDALPTRDYYHTIFSHDFAKAFWGDYGWCPVCGITNKHLSICSYMNFPFRSWQYHLRQMVIEDEPLKYLEKFLEIKINKKGKNGS